MFSLKKTMKDNDYQEDSLTNIYISSIYSLIKSNPMQTKIGHESKSQGLDPKTFPYYVYTSKRLGSHDRYQNYQ